MAIPAKGKGSDRGMATGAPKSKAPQPTKRASMKASMKRPTDAAPKRMGRR